MAGPTRREFSVEAPTMCPTTDALLCEPKKRKLKAMMLGQKPISDVEAISSGSIAIDSALGIGGYPRGRIIEIYGPESSGKTTLALHAIAEIQKTGGVAAFVDAEHALDPTYSQALGVDIENLLVAQPDHGELRPTRARHPP